MKVLIALENGQAADGARGVFKQIGAPVVKVVEGKKDALEALQQTVFNMVLAEDTFSDLGGVDFCRFLRMVNNPLSVAPLIICMKDPNRRTVEQARDAGINKIILMPFTTGSLLKTIQDVMLQPRPFVQITGYSGPCRRHNAPTVKAAGERRKAQEGLMEVAQLQKYFKGVTLDK